MIIVGLTGGIASGKTFVVNYLKKIKIPTHESDEVVRDFYKKKTTIFILFLKKEGFEKALTKNKIDKKKIRDIIFSNPLKKKKLEKFLHNEVKKKRDIFLNKNKKKQIVFLDIPLLFENKLSKNCNFICSTHSPVNVREKRALKRPGMNKKTFKLIIKSQIKESLRKKKSDYLINTSGSKKKTCLQVDNIIFNILGANNERGSIRHRNNRP